MLTLPQFSFAAAHFLVALHSSSGLSSSVIKRNSLHSRIEPIAANELATHCRSTFKANSCHVVDVSDLIYVTHGWSWASGYDGMASQLTLFTFLRASRDSSIFYFSSTFIFKSGRLSARM
jgi:hypothetical protein